MNTFWILCLWSLRKTYLIVRGPSWSSSGMRLWAETQNSVRSNCLTVQHLSRDAKLLTTFDNPLSDARTVWGPRESSSIANEQATLPRLTHRNSSKAMSADSLKIQETEEAVGQKWCSLQTRQDAVRTEVMTEVWTSDCGVVLYV